MMKLLTLGLALASLSLAACQNDTSMMVESADAPMATELTCESEKAECDAELATCDGEAKAASCCDDDGACSEDEGAM